MRKLLGVLCAGISITLSTAANALVAVGSLDMPGIPNDVEVVGHLAYVAASGNRSPASLRIIDVSSPAAPVEIGALDTLEAAGDVEVVGDVAYLAAGSAGMRVIDVSNPTSPMEIGVLDTPGSVFDVEVVGDLAYLTGSYGLLVIDVSDPAAPVVLGALDTPGTVFGLDVAGNLAYVVGRGVVVNGGWLRVIDVSNPTLPVELGALEELGAPPDRTDVPYTIEVVGNTAYVAGEALEVSSRGLVRSIGGWLRAIDVSNPAAPVVLDALGMPVAGYGMTVVEGFAYVAAGPAGLRAVDVSDPTSLVERGILDVGVASDVEVVGNFAYVAHVYVGSFTTSGLHVIDTSEPRFPDEVGALDTPDAAWDLDVVDDLAYVVGAVAAPPGWGVGWLRVIDVSDPALPVELAVFETPGQPKDVEVVDGLAYVAESSGLLVIDVSDPALPVQIGAFETPDIAGDLEVMGDLAYVVGGHWLTEAWLRVIDVSEPTAPVEVGALHLAQPSYPRDVQVVGNLAYVADSEFGLRVIDVSDPSVPVEIGDDRWAHHPLGVDVAEGIAYLGDYPWLLRAIDFSDPTSPVDISSRVLRGVALDVEVVGNLAYVMDLSYGLRIIDVSDLPALAEVAGIYSSSSSFANYPDEADVEVVDGLIYMADRWNGLRIIDLGPEYAATLTIDLDIKPGSDPNSINPDDGGVVPVALLGSDAFDVSEVDVPTLKFGPGDAAPDHTHGPHVEDVNADGLPDLLVHFDTGESGIVFGTLVACVEGATLDGKPFNGCDAVRTVPDMDGDKLLDVEEAAIGTDALNPDTDGDGFEDGHEVFVMGTDPLNARDPKPVRERRGGRKRSR
jgi:hypothetical protein